MSNKNLVMRRTRGLAGPFFQACRTGGLVHGVGNAYGLGGALSVWSPLKLFAGGKLGAWYDPSDLSTLFQDSAGTIPVTADGQPVGKILDKSGNGNHAIQPTSGKRPTYRVASNAHWLDFDGVDDALYTATIDLSGTSKLTVFAGTANSKTLSTGTLIESSANYLNNVGSFSLLTPSLATSHISFGSHGSTAAGEKETQNPPLGQLEKRVITAAQDFATTNDYGCDYIRVHQIPIANLIGSGNTAVGAGPLGNYPVYIGARNNGSNAASGNSLWGRIYSLIFVGEMYNTETLVLTEQWIDAKMVGTVFEPVWSWYAYQVTLGATATFTRASTAYVVDHEGLYWQAAANWPRFNGARIANPQANGQLVYYNTTAGGVAIAPSSINLLMEPAATNKLIKSETIDTWTPSTQVTFAANYANAPNGSLTADRITSTVSTADRVQLNISHTSGLLYWIYSIFVKKDATATGYNTNITINFTSGGTSLSVGMTFSLATMTRISGTATVWGIKQVGQTDWYRVWVQLQDNGTANTVAALSIYPNVTNATPKSITAWGGQLESFTTPPTGPTSYIPTTTAAVTRAVDALAYSGVPADNETRFVVNGANVDVDDWNGTYPTPTTPKLLNSINVYNPLERPA